MSSLCCAYSHSMCLVAERRTFTYRWVCLLNMNYFVILYFEVLRMLYSVCRMLYVVCCILYVVCYILYFVFCIVHFDGALILIYFILFYSLCVCGIILHNYFFYIFVCFILFIACLWYNMV